MTGATSNKTQRSAIERVRALLRPEHVKRAADSPDGFIDVLAVDSTRRTPVMFAMRLPLVTVIYERWWRPGLGRLMKGRGGPSMTDEYSLASELLALQTGDTVIDIGCGPGNFTRRFSDAVAPNGLAIGFDGSRPMLERAQSEPGGDASTLVYVLGDATNLPFAEDSVDAICCFAALHMFPDPYRSLDEMVRTLKPGGRLAFLTSCSPDRGSLAGAIAVLGPASGQRMFGRNEIRTALEERGCSVTYHEVGGVVQIIAARLTGSA
ncbi:MAG: class I SAM-dependent methyltransferase [Solirubrobacterales bacterium]